MQGNSQQLLSKHDEIDEILSISLFNLLKNAYSFDDFH